LEEDYDIGVSASIVNLSRKAEFYVGEVERDRTPWCLTADDKNRRIDRSDSNLSMSEEVIFYIIQKAERAKRLVTSAVFRENRVRFLRDATSSIYPNSVDT
jgi:hypothetical protein